MWQGPILRKELQEELTNKRDVSSASHVLLSDSFLDAVHFGLVPLSVPHGRLLGFLQSTFQGFDPLHRRSEALLQFRELTPEVCVVSYQLQRMGARENSVRNDWKSVPQNVQKYRNSLSGEMKKLRKGNEKHLQLVELYV